MWASTYVLLLAFAYSQVLCWKAWEIHAALLGNQSCAFICRIVIIVFSSLGIVQNRVMTGFRLLGIPHLLNKMVARSLNVRAATCPFRTWQKREREGERDVCVCVCVGGGVTVETGIWYNRQFYQQKLWSAFVPVQIKIAVSSSGRIDNLTSRDRDPSFYRYKHWFYPKRLRFCQ